MKSRSRYWRWLFVLAALEAGAAFVALLAVPREGNVLSLSRIAILAVLGACALGGVIAALRPPASLDEAVRRAGRASALLIAFAALVSLLSAGALFLLRYAQPERLLPYYERLSPLLWYLLVVSLEALAWVLVARYGFQAEELRSRTVLWRAAGIALLLHLLAYGFVALTGIGTTPDSAYWGEPGVPVLAWQAALALACGAGAMLGGRLLRARRVDAVLAAAVWLLAVVVWLSVPGSVLKTSFYGPINPPTNMSLPNSDAGYYDSMAQSLLIGYPYQGDIPTRPLYITFLALLHIIFGERYNLITAAQTLVLALIPVALYLLGQRLHSRAAGIIAALFAIFREWNSLLVSSQTRVSNSRLILVDTPTLLLLLLACLLAVRWLQRRGRTDALLAGGAFGLLLLLRTQTLVILPFLLVLAVLAYGLRDRRWIMPVALVLAGLAAALFPWLLHNYLRSGQVTLDAPFEYQVIASQYKYTGNLDLSAVALEGKGVLGLLLTFAIKDPGFVAGFIATHFTATLIDSLLVLPLAAHYNGLFAPINLYWMDWPAHIEPLNAGLLLAYLAVIALGLGAAWSRWRWTGLVPLGFAVGYALANGIGRFSGWRYSLPADWVAYFYFAVGAAEGIRLLMTLFGAQAQEPVEQTSAAQNGLPWSKAAVTLGALALIGALPWMAEGLARPRYASESLPVLMNRLGSSPAVSGLHIDLAQVEAFVAQPQATLQPGRVLYPRFFTRGDGLASAHPWPAYAVRDFPRLGFLLLNQSRHDALIVMRSGPAPFPQGSDAIVLGCLHQDYIEVRLILFPATDTAYAGAPLTETCK